MIGKIWENNGSIALSVLYAKKEKIHSAYVCNHNSNSGKQVILLIIPSGEIWHYLAVKKFVRILRGVTSKHHGDFYCLNGLHSFATEKCESHEKVCENKDFCNAVMPSEITKILTFNQCQKSDKAPFIFYADLECLIGKTDEYRNNPENSSTSKVDEHIPSDFSMSTISSFQNIENKHHVYRS